MIRVGTAGWSYPDWEGIVYPRRKQAGFHPLAHLARYVQCVELNSSFYALPRAEHAERWVELVAEHPDFRFLAKLHQAFTHGPLPAVDGAPRGGAPDWPELAASWLAGIAPLERAGRLAALLLQFPAGFQRTAAAEARIERLVQLFGDAGRRPLAIELRHRTWFEPDALALLGGAGLAVAHIDLPAAREHPPAWHEPTTGLGYLRLHGRNAGTWFQREAGRDQRYDYLYGPDELTELADRARRLAGRCEETYVVTNNHFGGQALANALELRSLLEGTAVLAPTELRAHFPRLAESTRGLGQQRLF